MFKLTQSYSFISKIEVFLFKQFRKNKSKIKVQSNFEKLKIRVFRLSVKSGKADKRLILGSGLPPRV